MGIALAQFGVSILVIVVAGTLLARSADAIADITGLGRLMVGTILLAGATSLPELTIGINAIWMGLPDIAVGDLVGSSLFNLLILAFVDIIHRSRGAILSRVAAGHALSATISIALTAVAGMAILMESRFLKQTDSLIGPGSIAITIAYAMGIRMLFFDQLTTKSEALLAGDMTAVVGPRGRGSVWKPLGLYLLSAAAIFAIAPVLTRSAEHIAEVTGLGGTFVGTTLVALATSLPELVATLAAVRLGSADLAIGNIFGSNAFNMLLMVPLDLAGPGSLFATVSLTHAVTCFAVVIVASVVVLGQLYRVERRVLFVEPDAALVITLVGFSLWIVYVAG